MKMKVAKKKETREEGMVLALQALKAPEGGMALTEDLWKTRGLKNSASKAYFSYDWWRRKR